MTLAMQLLPTLCSSQLSTVLVSLAVALVWLRWLSWRRESAAYAKLPQVSLWVVARHYLGWPLFEQAALSNRCRNFLAYLCERYADRKLVVVAFPGPRNLLLIDPSYIEQVLTSPVCLEKPSEYDQVRVYVGNALAVADVPVWKAHRRIAASAFTSTAVNGYLPVFVECALRLRERLLQSQTKHDLVPDLYAECERTMLEVVSQTAIGLSLEQVEHGDRRTGRTPFDFIGTLNSATQSIFQRTFNAIYHYDWIFRRTRIARETAEKFRVMNAFLDALIDERIGQRRAAREELTSNEPVNQADLTGESGQQTRYYARMRPGMCFLDLLLDTHLQQEPLDLPPAKRMDRRAIREEMIMFSFGGFDTTSVLLFNTIYLLGLHPDAQQRAFEELLEVLGTEGEDDVQPEQLARLVYLDACIKESLRLIPTVPFIGRKVAADLRLDDGVCIPGGSTVGAPLNALLLSGRHFEQPLAYRPERFLDAAGSKPMPAYLPFSLGVRNCVGMRFALVELKVTLALLLRRLRFESIVPFSQLRHLIGVVMKPNMPVPVRVFDRQLVEQ